MQIHRQIVGTGFTSSVVVGFTRFATYAVARAMAAGQKSQNANTRGSRTPVFVFTDAQAEGRASARVALQHLNMAPALCRDLAKLGVGTVGELLVLPAESVHARFGVEAHDLHQHASGRAWDPLVAEDSPEPPQRALTFDHAVSDTTALLFACKRLLPALLEELATRGQALTALTLRLQLESRVGVPGTVVEECLRPATATLEAAVILDLVRLRLEASKPTAAVTQLCLQACGLPADDEQLRLFAAGPRRDRTAAARALARLRAEFGEYAVVVAKLRQGHLPEACFTWEPFGDPPAGPTPPGTAAQSGAPLVATAPLPAAVGAPCPRRRLGGLADRGPTPAPARASGEDDRALHRFRRVVASCRTPRISFCTDRSRRNSVGLTTTASDDVGFCTPWSSDHRGRNDNTFDDDTVTIHRLVGAAVYTPLWCKSNYSFLEAASHPEELVESCAMLGLPGMALTDRDGVYGVVRAHVRARELGVHLILGSEITLYDDSRIVLLAADRNGYRNLCRLITKGRLRCHKGLSQTTWREVYDHAEGLIALWGGPASLLAGAADPGLIAGRTRRSLCRVPVRDGRTAPLCRRGRRRTAPTRNAPKATDFRS